MKSSLGLGKYRDLLFAILLFIVLDLGILFFNFFASIQLERDASRINAVGELRMLTQQITKSLLTLQIEKKGELPIQTSMAQLTQGTGAFVQGLAALKSAMSKDAEFTVFGLNPDDLRETLGKLERQWLPLKETIDPVIGSPDPSIEDTEIAATKAVARNIRLMHLSDDLANGVEAVAQTKAERMRQIQVVAIILALINFVYIVFKFLRRLNASDRVADAARQETDDILKTVSEGLLLVRADGTVGTQLSAAVHRLFMRDIKPGEDFRQLLRSLLTKERAEEAQSYLDLLFDPKVKPALLNQLDPLKDVQITVPGDASGKVRFLTFQITQLREAGRIKELLVTVFDVTQKVQLERALLQRTAEISATQAKLQATFDAIPDMVWLKDVQGIYLDCNPMFEHFFGAKKAAILGKTVYDFLEPEQADSFREHDRQVIAAGQASVNEEWLTFAADGRRGLFETTRTPMRDGDGQLVGVLGITHDITEHKQAQEEILRLNASLEERVQRRTAQLQAANQELEAFSYSVSHDLRSPLNTINGFSNLLDKEIVATGTSERSTHYLARIRAGAVQMGELIDALLSLAQVSRTSLRRERVDLSALAQTVLSGYREREPGRVVQFDIQPELVVEGDPRLLRNVLDNLLGNAWKFSAKQARSEITFGHEKGSTDETVYFVRDNGAGFDMAYVDKLFGAFQRLHTVSEFAGTGIGLATVHRIVMRHGGRVWAESAPGCGATFYFTLGRALAWSATSSTLAPATTAAQPPAVDSAWSGTGNHSLRRPPGPIPRPALDTACRERLSELGLHYAVGLTGSVTV